MKKCPKCKETKSFEEFGCSKSAKSGYQSWCKLCLRIRQQNHRIKQKANPPSPPKSKRCSMCGQEKLASEFTTSTNTKTGLASACRECLRKLVQSNPTKEHNRYLLYQYGITSDDYSRLLEQQNGKCAICDSQKSISGRFKFFCVDHDHDTGKIRGLLCGKCNAGIGLLGDDPDRLEAATAYLRRHQCLNRK